MRKTIRLPLLVAIALFFFAHTANSFQLPDNPVERPRLGYPAIVEVGTSFDIRIRAGEPPVINVLLTPRTGTGETITLEPGPADIHDNYTDYTISIPADVPTAFYDLALEFEGGGKLNRPSSVKVIADFKDEYTFVHLTDIHFNVGSNVEKKNAIRELVLKEISALDPEFVLFTGDIGLWPRDYERDYPFGFERFEKLLTAPVFMTPGNHEFYIDNELSPPIDGKKMWDAFYGPEYKYFDYGAIRFLGLNSFDWPTRWRDRQDPDVEFSNADNLGLIGPAQWKWFKGCAAQARDSGKSIVVFTHIPLEIVQGGMMLGKENPEKLEGPTFSKILSLFRKANVTHVFVGHIHMNSTRDLGGVTEIVTTGMSSQPQEGTLPGFRIVHVKNNKIVDMEIRGYTEDDLTISHGGD